MGCRARCLPRSTASPEVSAVGLVLIIHTQTVSRPAEDSTLLGSPATAMSGGDPIDKPILEVPFPSGLVLCLFLQHIW